MNRLAQESSPYLLQHRDNPVDWFPWGDEAFAEARRRDVPVLLSVGYSTCHWCHVMAHESFEDAQTAAQMNRDFVNVKVDREERPDVDAVYMTATQALTGQGGWPMILTSLPRVLSSFGEICRGWDLNTMVLAQRCVAPASRAARMPGFVSGKDHCVWSLGSGWGCGMTTSMPCALLSV